MSSFVAPEYVLYENVRTKGKGVEASKETQTFENVTLNPNGTKEPQTYTQHTHIYA